MFGDEGSKKDKTGRNNRKNQKYILKKTTETNKRGQKQTETGRNKQKQIETDQNVQKWTETGRNEQNYTMIV